MQRYRTDLAMERTGTAGPCPEGVCIQTEEALGAQITRVAVLTDSAARKLEKPVGTYWTLTHPGLASLEPEERAGLAGRVAGMIRMLLPPEGEVLVLGLGNRRMTADALGDHVVSGILVTRHLKPAGLRSVCALAPGVLGVTGIETAEMTAAIVERLHPAAVIAVDALAAMETAHLCTTIQVTDTGISPGSGVGNHRAGLDRKTLGVPVIAVGVPMVVYTSTIVRDALTGILSGGAGEDAEPMAWELTQGMPGEMIVTTRDVDITVAGLGDMLALAVNLALQPEMSREELTMYLH